MLYELQELEAKKDQKLLRELKIGQQSFCTSTRQH